MGEDDDGAIEVEADTGDTARVSGICGAAGVLLAGAAWLPLVADGPSFVELARAILEGLGPAAAPLLLMLGAPFLFGVALAIGGLVGGSRAVTGAIAGLTAILQADLVYMSLQTWHLDGALARGALVGFAIVTSGAMIAHSSATRARGDAPSLRWNVRWGALVIAGAALWIRLQGLAGAPIGLAVDVVLIAAAIVVWASRPGARAG